MNYRVERFSYWPEIALKIRNSALYRQIGWTGNNALGQVISNGSMRDRTETDLVTGGCGFIGSHLVDALLKEGRDVRVLDNLSVGQRRNLSHHDDNPHLTVIEGDVADRATADAAVAGVGRIFHLAARADVVPSIELPDEYFRSNVVGTFELLEAARRHEVRRLVYTASSSCYGIPDRYPTPEESPIDARYPYALTKYLGECQVLHWGQVYSIPVLSLRFFNVYGPRARTSGTYGAVFGVFLAQLLAGEPLTIVGDGEQTRDFTFVSDAVGSLMAAADSDRSGRVYNVGTGNPQSVNRLVELIGAQQTVHIPKRPGEPDCTMADVDRISREIGWTAQVPFEEGVRIMLENIDYWRDAPVWTVDGIADATKTWFKYLDDESKCPTIPS